MIRDQLREAYRLGAEREVDRHPFGSTTALSSRHLPPDQIEITGIEELRIPLNVDVELVPYVLESYSRAADKAVYRLAGK